MVTGEYPYSECQYAAQVYRKVVSVWIFFQFFKDLFNLRVSNQPVSIEFKIPKLKKLSIDA